MIWWLSDTVLIIPDKLRNNLASDLLSALVIQIPAVTALTWTAFPILAMFTFWTINVKLHIFLTALCSWFIKAYKNNLVGVTRNFVIVFVILWLFRRGQRASKFHRNVCLIVALKLHFNHNIRIPETCPLVWKSEELKSAQLDEMPSP